MLRHISLVLILLIDLITYLFTSISIYQERTLYPYLRDTDMSAWKYVVNVGVLHWSITVAIVCIIVSFLLGITYYLKLRNVKYRVLSIFLIGLTIFSIVRILILTSNLTMLLNVSTSLKPCEQEVLHIQCSPIEH
jgi:hypothetical protein